MHIFSCVYLTAVSFVKCLFKSFACYNGFEVLYTFQREAFYHLYLQSFLLIFGSSFNSLNSIFQKADIFIFDEVQFFLSWIILFKLQLRNLCLTQDDQVSSIKSDSFRSTLGLWLKWFFVEAVICRVKIFFLYRARESFQNNLLKTLCISHSAAFAPLSKIYSVYIYIYWFICLLSYVALIVFVDGDTTVLIPGSFSKFIWLFWFQYISILIWNLLI